MILWQRLISSREWRDSKLFKEPVGFDDIRSESFLRRACT
jgi:hypothetical protein